MVNKLHSLHIHDLEEAIQELSQSLIGIKENIMECMDELENTVQINPSLIYTMKNSMKDVERAKAAVYGMNFNFKKYEY